MSRRRSRQLSTKASATNDIVTRSELPARSSKIVCIGDVHGMWDETDENALRALRPDLALFVGDYGDEDVRVTKRLSQFADEVDFGVATVFGNHDAFFTASKRGRRNAPYDKGKGCRVKQQIEMLAQYDVSYRSVPFDDIRVSVCGGRSFSWGGPNWKYGQFYREYLGIQNITHSANKIRESVHSSKYRNVIFLSHSGPFGLGDKPSDPCGKDWGEHPGGDYGDTDLRLGIDQARAEGLQVPLTVFGHMHKQLKGTQGLRTMLKTEPDGDSGAVTIMLNAAVVPRRRIDPQSNSNLHHFQIVQLGDNGYVDTVEEAWVNTSGQISTSTTLFDKDKFFPMALTEAAAVTGTD